MLILISFFLLFVDTRASFSSFLLGYDEHCTYTREDAIKCFAKYIDTNKDETIDLHELEIAKTKYLGWALKLIQWVASWQIDVSTHKIMEDCGAGTKGYFTADDFRRTKHSCMPSHEAMCMVKMVCETAAKNNAPPDAPRVKTWWNKWV
jgi:hypothetical protein